MEGCAFKVENRRKHYRVQFEKPICTKISIVKVNGKSVKTGTSHICIDNISIGGLKFISSLDFSPTINAVIEFQCKFASDTFKFYGNIIRKENLEDGLLMYGVEFINKAEDNVEAITRLNELFKNDVIGKNSFCNGQYEVCLKYNKFKNDRRKFERYKLKDNFKIKLEINYENDLKVVEAIIKDVSENGIQIKSHAKLIVSREKELNFKFYIEDEIINSKGYIIRFLKNDDNSYIYGVKLVD